jgi:glutamate dehydrogenase/leucine dehydrogenase
MRTPSSAPGTGGTLIRRRTASRNSGGNPTLVAHIAWELIKMSTDVHEQVTWFADPEVGLRAIVAIHSTALGPALGGIRFWRYASEAAALEDALRLSRAMTMKAAVAGLCQGGGKAVVLWDDQRALRSEAFLGSLGRSIDALGGRYLAAEDVGATQRDMDEIARETAWVTGVDPARGGSGDPSPVTAFGVLHGMRAALDTRDLRGRRVGDLRHRRRQGGGRGRACRATRRCGHGRM